MAVVGSLNSPGLYVYSGVDTGNLVLVGTLYDPSYTLPEASPLQPAGATVTMGPISTLGFSLDGKYVVAGDSSLGNDALLVIPFSSAGFGAAPALVYADSNVGIPYNDQMIIH
jgi:hypothetical protein